MRRLVIVVAVALLLAVGSAVGAEATTMHNPRAHKGMHWWGTNWGTPQTGVRIWNNSRDPIVVKVMWTRADRSKPTLNAYYHLGPFEVERHRSPTHHDLIGVYTCFTCTP